MAAALTTAGETQLDRIRRGDHREDEFAILRLGVAARNAIAHGLLNQVGDTALFEKVRGAARLARRFELILKCGRRASSMGG
jgi:hypothetical protein